jgi:hypothetical protein
MAALATILAATLAVGAGAQEKPVVMTHDLEGRSACLACHGGAMEAIVAAPETHTGRPDATCLWCHAADAGIQTTAPNAITHDLEGRSACLMCHAAGAMEAIPDVPASHEGRGDEFCTLCHQPAG